MKQVKVTEVSSPPLGSEFPGQEEGAGSTCVCLHVRTRAHMLRLPDTVV